MSIAIYRNKLNQEMKRFGKFCNSITDNLAGLIGISLIFNENKSECLEHMKNHDTIIIVSHGGASEIYHRYGFDISRNQVLISSVDIHNNIPNVIEAIKNKKIIAISCGTATSLGEVACAVGGCKTYLGFKHKIHFDKINKANPSHRYHEFLSKCYKEAFSIAIERGIRESWSFNKFKLVLKVELEKNVTKKALEIKSSKPNFYKNHGIDQAVIAVTNVSNDIHIFGDATQAID